MSSTIFKNGDVVIVSNPVNTHDQMFKDKQGVVVAIRPDGCYVQMGKPDARRGHSNLIPFAKESLTLAP